MMDERGTSDEAARSGKSALSIDIVDRGGLLPLEGAPWLRAAAGRALAPLGLSGEVRVAVVGDAEMARTHGEFCGDAGTTDVLTFDCTEPVEGPVTVVDADILVCIDEARRQGVAFGHAPERELLLYIVHGVLHCLGYDDHDEEAAAAMHRREDELLGLAGIGPTYAPPAAPKGGAG